MKTIAYVSMISFGLISNTAFASLDCALAMVSASQESPAFSSFTVPNHSAISSKFSHKGYKFTVDCDLHSRPNKLSLSIVGPNGESTSTSSENELKLIDEGGNGALIRCTAQ